MVCVRTLKDPYPPSDVLHNFLPLPPKIRGGGVLVSEIRTKKGVIKKLLRNRGLVERGGGGPLRKGRVPNYFVSFP